MKKLFNILLILLFTIGSLAQTKVYTKGGVFYMVDTQTTTQYEGTATDVLVVRSKTSSTDFYFHNVNGWGDAQYLNISEIQNEAGVVYTIDEFIAFYENSTDTKISKDYYLSVSNGEIAGQQIVNKFGRNGAVGTALTVVTIGGNYRTPLTAQAIEFVSTDANDTFLGTGARTIRIAGLDSNYDQIQEDIQTNGLTPVALTNNYIRIYRFAVISSGTYATQTTGSHFGELVLQGTGGGDEWGRITVEGTFGIGQSQIGAFTIPRGYTGELLNKVVTVETGKPTSIYFYKRESADDITSPFDGTMRLFEQNDGVEQPLNVGLKAPIQTFPEMTDVGFFAKVSVGTASVSVDFQILLTKN